VFADRVADYSDDEEDFSSNDEGEAEGSDSEPTAEDALGRRARKAARAKIPTNARVRFFHCTVQLGYLDVTVQEKLRSGWPGPFVKVD
jgi:hypothetical protein